MTAVLGIRLPRAGHGTREGRMWYPIHRTQPKLNLIESLLFVSPNANTFFKTNVGMLADDRLAAPRGRQVLMFSLIHLP